MGKSQKAQEEGFNLLEESTQAKKEDRKAETTEEDIYNILRKIKVQYSIKKSKSNKTNFTITLQSKDQLVILLDSVKEIQNALKDNEYVTTPIAQRHPYSVILVITKTNTVVKITYLSGFIKNVNMSIPVSANTINALQAILSALNTELGKKLLSVSNISNQSNSTENLL